MHRPDPDIQKALSAVDAMMRRGEPYATIMDALDACLSMPSGRADAAAIELRRIAIAQVYRQDDEEISRILSQAIPVLRADVPVTDWVLSVSAPCMQRPSIAPHFVPQALAELRAHLDSNPDPAGEEIYRMVQQGFERTMSGME